MAPTVYFKLPSASSCHPNAASCGLHTHNLISKYLLEALLAKMEQYQWTEECWLEVLWQTSQFTLCQLYPGKLSVQEWHHQWRWFFCEESVCVCVWRLLFPHIIVRRHCLIAPGGPELHLSTYRTCHITSPGVLKPEPMDQITEP